MRTIIGTDDKHILVYADWKSQEAVIQAHLSKDKNMIGAVNSGDPYLFTAKMAKEAQFLNLQQKTHGKERELYKQSFAIGYGQTPFGLMNKLNMTLPNATFIHSQIVNYYKSFSGLV